MFPDCPLGMARPSLNDSALNVRAIRHVVIRTLLGRRSRQRGYYDLLSIGIGASIAIAFATVGLWEKREEMLSQQMAAQGDVVKDIGNFINGR
jgi:hypothetical protein